MVSLFDVRYFSHVNNTGVMDVVMDRESTEYSIHALAEVVDGKKRNDCILVTRYRIGK